MTLKIEIACDGETATFRLSGRIEEDHLVELQAEVRRYRPRLVFDLAETTLVDLAVEPRNPRPYRLPCLFGSTLFH